MLGAIIFLHISFYQSETMPAAKWRKVKEWMKNVLENRKKTAEFDDVQ